MFDLSKIFDLSKKFDLIWKLINIAVRKPQVFALRCTSWSQSRLKTHIELWGAVIEVCTSLHNLHIMTLGKAWKPTYDKTHIMIYFQAFKMTAILTHRSIKSVRAVIKEKIQTKTVIGGPYMKIRRNHWDRLSVELKDAMRLKVILHWYWKFRFSERATKIWPNCLQGFDVN